MKTSTLPVLAASMAASVSATITGFSTGAVGVADGFLYCRQYKPAGKSFGCYGDDLGDLPVQKHYKALTLAYPIPNINAPLDAAVLMEPGPVPGSSFMVHTTEQIYVDTSADAFAPVRVTPRGVGNATLSGGETTAGFHLSYVLSWYDADAHKIGDGWAWVAVDGHEGLFQLYWDQKLFDATAVPATYAAINKPISSEVTVKSRGVREEAPAPERRGEEKRMRRGMAERRQTAPAAPYPRVGVFGGIASQANFEWMD